MRTFNLLLQGVSRIWRGVCVSLCRRDVYVVIADNRLKAMFSVLSKTKGKIASVSVVSLSAGIAVVVAVLLVPSCGSSGGVFEQRVAESVALQISHYPDSRLVDVYKNFFHDKFGPGHMIADSAAAGAYLRRELQSVNGPSQDSRAEVTGWEGNFVRVDLVVLKDGVVDYSTFMEAFMESAQGVQMPSVEEWRVEWRKIERVIRRLYPQLPDLDKDSKFLDSLLAKGKYVVHHSEIYSQQYDPHYRLFRKEVYETRLQPLLDSSHFISR